MSGRMPLTPVSESEQVAAKSSDSLPDPPPPPTKSSSRHSLPPCRGPVTDDQPHVGNYRLLKTIGKGNFAKVKLARHILTGREIHLLCGVDRAARSAVVCLSGDVRLWLV